MPIGIITRADLCFAEAPRTRLLAVDGEGGEEPTPPPELTHRVPSAPSPSARVPSVRSHQGGSCRVGARDLEMSESRSPSGSARGSGKAEP